VTDVGDILALTMIRSTIRLRCLSVATLALSLHWGGCRKEAPAPAPSTAASEASTPEGAADPKPSAPPLRHITLGMADTTREDERPVDLSDEFAGIIKEAAKEAGFTLVEDGHEGGLAFYYAVIQDGKVAPKADKGMLVWGVQAELTIKDEDLLKTTWDGVGRGEAPFVRAALPDLTKAFRELLKGAAVTALRDIDMKIRYEKATVEQALKGLDSHHPEEVWAGLRRLGELGATDAIGAIIDVLKSGDKATKVVAGGVIARLGDRKAVAPLLAAALELTDPVAVLFAADVISQLGGPEAQKALETLRSDHANEEVKRALTEIMERGPEAP